MKTAAVVVAYHPEPAALARLAARLRGDGADVVIVDNTPGPPATPEIDGAQILRLGRNAGIAHAQNRGIAAARARGARAIAFFDQDSEPPGGMLPALSAALREGEAGVAGPVCIDAAGGFEYPSFRVARGGLPRPVLGRGAAQPFEVDLMISSGSIATVETFDRAGTMDEDFFIDFVDHEWCLRCRAQGIAIRVLPALEMPHRIGERALHRDGRAVFVHGAARSYYRVRNPFLLLRRAHVPRLLALKEIAAALVHHLLALPHVPDRRAHLRAGAAGLWHGLRGVTGMRPP